MLEMFIRCKKKQHLEVRRVCWLWMYYEMNLEILKKISNFLKIRNIVQYDLYL